MAESGLSLVERLRAALDRAEEIARSAALRSPAPWRFDGDPWASPGQGMVDASGNGLAVAVGSYVADHIIANDPASVLRTVAAHRKILERYETAVIARDAAVDTPLAGATRMALRLARENLEIVAAVYFPEAPDA